MIVCLLLVSGLATAVGENGKISLLFLLMHFPPFIFFFFFFFFFLIFNFKYGFSHSTLLLRHRKQRIFSLEFFFHSLTVTDTGLDTHWVTDDIAMYSLTLWLTQSHIYRVTHIVAAHLFLNCGRFLYVFDKHCAPKIGFGSGRWGGVGWEGLTQTRQALYEGSRTLCLSVCLSLFQI